MTRPSHTTVTDEGNTVVTLMPTIEINATPNSLGVTPNLVYPVSMATIAKLGSSENSWVMDTSQNVKNLTHNRTIEETRTTRMPLTQKSPG
jgi:hypothetical protein